MHVHSEGEGAIQRSLWLCVNITESIATLQDFPCAFAMVVSDKNFFFFHNFLGEIDVILLEVEQQPLEGILILPKRNSQITTIAESIFQPSCYTTIFSINHDRNSSCYALYPIYLSCFIILLPLLFYTFATGINFLDMLHHVCDVPMTETVWTNQHKLIN